ncbi:hypothetical protein C3495_04495 [Clostridiaceae bacterium 14S0207]|nr:hypothetical protein C3495_04495 [Clostridiaceae bacterium 14S0207]
MDVESNSILINKDILEKVKTDVNKIKILSNEEEIKVIADEILLILEKRDLTTGKKIVEMTILDRIKQKMKDTTDKDLNVKLYILYRKLEDKKISEDEALRLFEIYVNSEYTEGYI